MQHKNFIFLQIAWLFISTLMTCWKSEKVNLSTYVTMVCIYMYMYHCSIGSLTMKKCVEQSKECGSEECKLEEASPAVSNGLLVLKQKLQDFILHPRANIMYGHTVSQKAQEQYFASELKRNDNPCKIIANHQMEDDTITDISCSLWLCTDTSPSKAASTETNAFPGSETTFGSSCA